MNERQTPETDATRRDVMAGKWSLTEPGGLLEKLETLKRQRDEAREMAREGRLAGRQEALAILLGADPETALDNFVGSRSLADTGDYVSFWKEDELRAFFDAHTGTMHSMLESLDHVLMKVCMIDMPACERQRDEALAQLAQTRADKDRNNQLMVELIRHRDGLQSRIDRAVELTVCALTDDAVVGAFQDQHELILSVLEGREGEPQVRHCALGDMRILKGEVGAIVRQRDDLLAALERVLASATPNPRDNPAMYPVWESANAAIAAVKGKK